MRRLILIISIWALASARPETYREKEDFQYSRSSSDDGTKAGFYGAQRGNMGGNFERAHNMDSLAQHQMGSLVTQVDGELGSGADSKSGSVYTAGNSRGTFGSGHYDLSVLKGRNFAEGTSSGNSEAYSSALNSGYHGHTYSTNNAQHNSRQSQSSSRNLGYQAAEQTGSYIDTNNQEVDNSQYRGLDQGYSNQAASNYKFHTQASNQDSSQYDLNRASESNAQIRSMSMTPLKVYVRPGSKVTIPIAAQTYDASQLGSSHAENALISDAELLGNSKSGISYTPTNNAKHYESSYSYRKEWEKHDTLPLVTPTENPFPKHSELYDADGKLILLNSNLNNLDINSVQDSKLSNVYASGYRANSKSSSSHDSRYQTDYNTEVENTAAAADSSAATVEAQLRNSAGANNLIEGLGTKPKSYHSSYSYHKSWERQGDPYVIKPASGDLNDISSQRLTSASENFGQRSSQHRGSHYNYAQHAYSQSGNPDCDCDENGLIRVPRSYNNNNYQNVQEQNYFRQHQHNGWENQKDVSQETQEKLEDLGQQSENNWDNLGQQTQNQWNYLEAAGQQEDNKNEKLEDLGQQSQNKWDNLENVGQQSQNKWDTLEAFSQQAENKEVQLGELGQQSQNKWDNLENLGQHSQNKWNDLENLNQQSQNKWDNLENLEQHSQNKWNDFKNLEQQSQNKWNNMEAVSNKQLEDLEQSQNKWDVKDVLGQQVENKHEKIQDLGQQSQNQWDNLEVGQHTVNDNEKLEDLGQQTQNKWNNLEILSQQSHNKLDNTENAEQQTQNQWDHFEYLGQQTQNNRNFVTHSKQHTQSGLEQNGQNENNIRTEKLNNVYSYNKQLIEQQDQDIYNKTLYQYQNILNTVQNIKNNFENERNQNVWSSVDHHKLNQRPGTVDEQERQTNNDKYNNFWDQFDQETFDHQTSNIAQGAFYSNYYVPKIDVPKNIQEESPLTNLWGKLDQISGISQGSISATTDNNLPLGSQYYNKNLLDIEHSKNQNVLFEFDSTQSSHPVQHLNINNRNKNTSNEKLNNNKSDQPKDSYHENTSFNVGRGDIESDDTLIESTSNSSNYGSSEVESSNLKKNENISYQNQLNINQTSTLSYFNSILDKNQNSNHTNMEKQLRNEKIDVISLTDSISTTEGYRIKFNITTLPSTSQNEGRENIEKRDNINESSKQQNMKQEIDNLDQQYQKLDTQSLLDLDQHTQMQENIPEVQLENFRPINSYKQNDEQQRQNFHTFGGENGFEQQLQNEEQQLQNVWMLQSEKNMEQFDHTDSKHDEIVTKKVVENQAINSDSIAKNHGDVAIPIEVLTEKPSFWKSVGNKLTNAKDSVVSWFKSS